MSIFTLFLNALQESGEIICLRAWAWEHGIEYKNAHVALRQAKEKYPKQIKIIRLCKEQGRPLSVKWIGD
jgi:hypothetical protein